MSKSRHPALDFIRKHSLLVLVVISVFSLILILLLRK